MALPDPAPPTPASALSSPSREPTRAAPPAHPGPLLRDWRQRRRLSQMALALDVGISPRHLSFVETGRARPSAQLVLALAERLALPLRERNRLLLSGGYAPRFTQRPLAAPDMQPVHQALERLLAAHQPFPGLVLDRCWNVVLANPAALGLAALLPEALRGPPLNILRASLHPDGFARFTRNFDDWAGHLLAALGRSLDASADPALQALDDEVRTYPNVQALLRRDGPQAAPASAALVLPCVLALPQGELSLFTTLASFGTPRDVTLDELCIELFYPADAATEARLRQAAAGAPT